MTAVTITNFSGPEARLISAVPDDVPHATRRDIEIRDLASEAVKGKVVLLP